MSHSESVWFPPSQKSAYNIFENLFCLIALVVANTNFYADLKNVEKIANTFTQFDTISKISQFYVGPWYLT